MLWDLFLLLVGLALAALGVVNVATAPFWFALAAVCVVIAAIRWQRVRLSLLLVNLGVWLGGRPATTVGGVDVPPDVDGLPAAAADVVRRVHDAIDAENAHWERAQATKRSGVPQPQAMHHSLAAVGREITCTCGRQFATGPAFDAHVRTGA